MYEKPADSFWVRFGSHTDRKKQIGGSESSIEESI